MKLFGLNKLSGEKRKELIIVLILTVVVLAGLGFGLIKYQYSVLAGLEVKQAEVNKRLEQMHNMVRRAALTEEELAASSMRLSELEADMASRDLYFWIDTTLRRFKQSYKVEVPQVGQPVPGEVTLISKFPYKQASFKVSGTARYYELGRFVADFENQYPHMRLLNLDVAPASVGNEPGMISFSMDIVTLINPDPS